MSPASAPTLHARIQEQYEAFPYPSFRVLEAEDPDGRLGTSLSLDLGLPPGSWLPEKPRFWVAGASTRVAVQLALQHREAQVVGSDLSGRSLEMQARVAKQLGLRNVELRREDLTRAGYRSEFDYVSALGVIMLLESPAAGMAALRSALRPGGVVELTLYGRLAREDAQRSQEILRTIDPHLSALQRMGLAAELLTSLDVTALGRRHPLVKLGRGLAGGAPERLNELSPIVSHPFEHSYDVYEAIALVEQAGLRVRGFKNPVLSAPERYIRSEKLAPRLRSLSAVDRQQLAYLLGLARHELFAEDRRKARPFVSVLEQPIDDLVLRGLPQRVEHRFEGDRLVGTRRRRRLQPHARGFVVQGGEWRPGASAYATARIVPPITARLLELADKRRTVGDVLSKIAREQRLSRSERRSLRHLLAQLLVPPSRLFAVSPRAS